MPETPAPPHTPSSAAPAPADPPAAGGVAALVAAARARTREIAPADVAAAQRAGAVVVDLREPEELARDGRIPGAVHVPRGMLEWRADPASASHEPALDPARPVVLYCAGGGRSALAADALRALGYRDVSHLGAGFGGWVGAGQPVERSDAGTGTTR